jgi:hypothetical protein
MFARRLAYKPNNDGQRSAVIKAVAPAKVAAAAAALIDDFIADPAVSAATLVMPRVTTLVSLATMAVSLRGLPQWEVTTSPLPATPAGELIAIRMARRIPFQRGDCPSEILVLGNFDEFPATRRAPVTALEIFVGAPMLNDPKTGTPTKKANLAHVQLGPLVGDSFDGVWERSVQGRKSSLGCTVDCDSPPDEPVCHDPRAKAKVSFVIPAKVAAQVGISV